MSWRGNRVQPAVEGGEEEEPFSGESEWLERRDHPLRNDLILDTLFGFVRRREMKACRVVSKNWNLRTIPHMRANFHVTIRGNYSRKPVSNFVKVFCSNELGIPFKSFKLGPFCTRDEVGQQFLQLCGKIATEIDMYGAEGEVYRVEDVSDLLRSCPNLKVLKFPSGISRSGSVVKLFPDSTPSFPCLRSIRFQLGSDELQKCCPSAIEELLTAAPHISDIRVSEIVKCYIAEDGNDSSKISYVLNCVEKLGREASIQFLDLYNAGIRHFEQLQRMAKKEKGMQLKSLAFKANLNVQEKENFDGLQIELATMFKDTLQHFNADLVAENKLMAFPFMPKLKSLELLMGLSISDRETVNLTQNFPNLERLDIIFKYHYDGLNFFSQFYSTPTVKSLRVEGRDTTIQTLNHILRVFPNLTKLSLRVGNDREEILRRIWSQMTGLESLHISLYTGGREEESLDSLLTGIQAQRLEEIRPLVNGCGFDVLTAEQKTETILKLTERYSGLPSIRNLTKLRHLVWNVGYGTHFILTDVTAYLALYSMNHLRHLEVRGCMFTKTCCEILTEETGIQSWGFLTRGYEKHIIPPFGLCESDRILSINYN